MDERSGFGCSGRVYYRLESIFILRVSTLFTDTQSFTKDSARGSYGHPRSSLLANTSVVPGMHGHVRVRSDSFGTEYQFTSFFGQAASSAVAQDYPGCRACIRKAFVRKKIPEVSIDIMMSSLSDSSIRQYDGALKKCWKFCQEQSIDPFTASILNVMVFLTNEFQKGISYGSANSYRSAVALILDPEVGQDASVKRFFRGFGKLRPPKPRYESTWDPRTVLTLLSQL